MEPGELALLLSTTLTLRGPCGRCFGGLQAEGQHWTHQGALQPAVLAGAKGMSIAQLQTAAILPCLCHYKYLSHPNGSRDFLWKRFSPSVLPESHWC